MILIWLVTTNSSDKLYRNADILPLTQIFAINLKATYVAAQEFGRRLLNLKRPGKIINIASLTSFIGMYNVSAYASSKGGVLQMTKAFSNEWAAKGIQVNCICPGYVEGFPIEATDPI